MFCQQQIGGSWKQQEDRITSREMNVLLLVAIFISAQFFGISNGQKGHKHHNHKPCKSKSNSKAEVKRGRMSATLKPLSASYGETHNPYKVKRSKKEDKGTKRKRRIQKVSKGKVREIGSEPNTQGGNLSRPSDDKANNYVIEVEQKHDTRKKARQKNLGFADINRFQNSDWLNKQLSRNEGERKQLVKLVRLDIPGCGGSVKL